MTLEAAVWRGAWVALLGVAIALRAAGLGFGLPDSFHPDEWRVLEVAAQLRGHPSAHVGFWNYPPALAGLVAALVPERAGMLGGRALVLCLGVGAAGVTGYAAHRLAGRRAGLTALALAAVSPLMVEQSRYLTVDVPTAFGASLVALATVELTRAPSLTRHALAGAAVGCCAAFKYVGALSALVVVSVVILQEPRRVRRWAPRLLLVGAAALGVFLLLNPPALGDLERLWRALLDEYGHYAVKRGGGYTSDRVWWHLLAYTALYGLTPVASLALVVGGVCGAPWRSRAWLAVLLGALAWGLFLATRGTFFARNLVHLLPLLAVAAGVAFERLTHRLRGDAAFGVALAVLVALPAWQSVAFALTLTQPDTREQAADWLRANLPRGEPVLVVPSTYEHYLPPARRHGHPLRQLRAGTPVGELRAQGQYVLVSWGNVGRYLRSPTEEPERAAELQRWYEQLAAHARLEARFEARPGPGAELFGATVDIYHDPKLELWRLAP